MVIGILSALLYLLVAISLDAAGYVESMTLLTPVTAGALVLGLLMSFSRFDALFALSHSLFTGLAWILFMMTSLVGANELERIPDQGITIFQAKAYTVLIEWVNWVEAAVNNAAHEDNYVFVFEIAFLIWWLTFLGIWAIFRYGYTWRAIIPAGIVLVINTYYAPENVLGFLVVFSLLALVLLVRTNLAEQQLRWREHQVYFSPDIPLDFMRNALFYSAVVLAIAWIAPGLGRSSPVRQALAPVSDRWESAMLDWNRLYEGLNRQSSQAAATFGNRLELGGARSVNDSPVFQVTAPVGRYWRAVTYDVWDGRGWQNSVDEQESYDAATAFPVAGWTSRQVLTQTIRLMSPTGYVMFGAPDIRQADVAVTGVVQPIPSENALSIDDNVAQEFISVYSRHRLEVGDSYTVVSNYAAITQRALLESETFYPAQITEQYLQLPEDFSPRVVELAEDLTQDEETVYEKAKAIESYLRTFPYNDAIDAPLAGVDPVEYFLFDIQEGYCDYYTTAMITMLRSIGIPARAAAGYAEGTYDDDSGFFIITDRDAHSWVEIYFPEFGWIEFEPTAGESELNRPLGEELEDSGVVPGQPEDFSEGNPFEEQFSEQDPNLSPGDFPDDEFLPDGGVATAGRSSWVWAILTPLLLLLGSVLLLFRTRFFGPTSFTPDLPPILFERVQSWAERLGINMGAQFTPYEQAGRLSQAVPETRQYVETITDSYVRYRFSPQSTNGRYSTEEEQKKLTSAWDLLRPLLRNAWLRKTFAVQVRRKQNPYQLTKRQ